MTPIRECIINKKTNTKPIWFMRQAGRYLPEFRKIRKENPDFVKLCLNAKLASEITLQPIKRFNLDAAIIFSDILMIPYGLGQNVRFEKNVGPILENINFNEIFKSNKNDFSNKLEPVYKALKLTSENKIIKDKDLIGFVGAPWTLLVYMINKKSPKKNINKDIFKNNSDTERLLNLICDFLKIHIKNQIDNGATIIQIFDSWAGLLEHKDIENFIYKPTLKIVEYVKSLNIPIICFPRNIKNYKEYVEIIKPDAINIDYEVDPKQIIKQIDIPVQGGLDPKILLSDKDILIKETKKYLDLFKNFPYIFNLGHGVLPETDPMMVDYLVKYVKNFK